MLKGMGGSTVGVWCAHGEGQATFPSAAVRQDVDARGLAPIRSPPPSLSLLHLIVVTLYILSKKYHLILPYNV